MKKKNSYNKQQENIYFDDIMFKNTLNFLFQIAEKDQNYFEEIINILSSILELNKHEKFININLKNFNQISDFFIKNIEADKYLIQVITKESYISFYNLKYIIGYLNRVDPLNEVNLKLK